MDRTLLDGLRSQREDIKQALRVQGSSVVYAFLREKDSPRGKAGSPYYIGVAAYHWRPYQSAGRKTPRPAEDTRIRMLRSGVTDKQARDWERFYIARYGRLDEQTGRQLVRNRTDGGEGVRGYRHTEETRARMCEGRKNPPAASRIKMSEARRGRQLTDEAKAKISAVQAQRPRGPLTAEHRALLSEALTGRSKSAETRQRLSEAHKGKTLSPEAVARRTLTRAKKTAAQYGIELAVLLALSPRDRKRMRDRYHRGKRAACLMEGITPMEAYGDRLSA